MVLSPIEPVAPRTVTLRGPEAAALLFRKGTALIVSPNHKTACGAMHTMAEEAENPGHQDGGDEAVEAGHQTAKAGDQVTGILDAEPALDGRFEEVAKLRDHRQQRANGQQGNRLA